MIFVLQIIALAVGVALVTKGHDVLYGLGWNLIAYVALWTFTKKEDR